MSAIALAHLVIASSLGYFVIGSAYSSFALDAGRLDHRPPALNLSLLLRCERRRILLVDRPALLADIGHALLHGLVGERFDHRGVEPGDDHLRRAFRHPEAVPERSVQAAYAGFVHGRHLGRRPPALLRQHRERLERAAAHVAEIIRGLSEREIDLAG